MEKTKKADTKKPHPPAAMRYVQYALAKAGVNIDIIDGGFTLQYMDPAWQRVYGNPIGKKCYRVFEGRSFPCPGCGIPASLRTGKIYSYEAVLPKEGNRPIQVITVPFKDESGKRLVAEVNIDITARKKAESAIRESEERYRVLAEAARDYIFTVDRQGVVTYMNTISLGLWKKFDGNGIGKRLDHLFGPSAARYLWRDLESVFRTGRPFSSEKEFEFPARQVWLSTRLTPVKDTHGKIVAVLGISRDITPLKAAEAILRRDKAELARLVKERTQALVSAQHKLDQAERLAEIGTLAATIAHELRNPLAAIRMAIFNISRKVADPALAGNLATIEKKVLESDQIITNLLMYAKVRVPAAQLVDVCALLDECAEHARSRYAASRVVIRRLYPVPCDAVVDPVQIKEVFNNILNNAFEALPSTRGTITLSVCRKGGKVVVGIADTGVGMPLATVRRLREPFFSTKEGGTGLGFPMCYKIVKLHGGDLSIRSAPGKGTTVRIAIPIRKKIGEKSQ